MTRISVKQARELGIEPGPAESKYHSQKVEVDGIVFDSRKEANKYCELKLQMRAGEVIKVELQPEFVLQEGYWSGHGKRKKWVRPIIYKADFGVTYGDGRVEIIDTKGFKNKVYLLKKKMLLHKYPGLNFIEE